MTIIAVAISFLSSNIFATEGLVGLNDAELSAINGTALMNMIYTHPILVNQQMTDENIGFYKLSLDAVMDLNVNVKSLQLGCGGVNGSNGCDIDIRHLALSGNAN